MSAAKPMNTPAISASDSNSSVSCMSRLLPGVSPSPAYEGSVGRAYSAAQRHRSRNAAAADPWAGRGCAGFSTDERVRSRWGRSGTADLIVATARPQLVLREQPSLVRQHDCLDPVAQIELLEDVRDVRLDGGLADVELLPDLCVR